jgi:hypothetical protein
MNVAMQRGMSVACLWLGLLSFATQARAREPILTAIPADAYGFAVVHDIAATSSSIGEVAKLVNAPVPDLASMAKTMSGVGAGVDEHGDLAIVVTAIEPVPTGVVLVPVTDFAVFFAALKVAEPQTGGVEVSLAGRPAHVGRKGDYAVVAQAKDREALEKYLASTTNLAGDTALAEWLDANRISYVVPTYGLKQLLPKLLGAIRGLQAQMRQAGGAQGQQAAAGFEMYVMLFTAAEPEVDQFAIGLRIDSAQTVELVKRIRFTPDGSWAKLAAEAPPVTEELLSGLPAGPFVVAAGAVLPARYTEQAMKFSMEIMKNQPMYNLNAEQAKKYGDLSTSSMQGVRSVEMLMGIAEPGTGLYGNTTVIMKVDDAKAFFERYEKAITAMGELAKEANSPALPIATAKHTTIGERDALEVSMTLPNLNQAIPPGGPNPQKMLETMLGPNGKLTVYLTAVDENTVIMSYVSIERLQSAIYFFESKQPGLLHEAGVAEVAAALPEGSQMVGYVSLDGIMEVVRQLMPQMPGMPTPNLPEFPPSPPIGMAAKVSATGVEGHLVVTAGTLKAIGEVVNQRRQKAAAGGAPR